VLNAQPFSQTQPLHQVFQLKKKPREVQVAQVLDSVLAELTKTSSSSVRLWKIHHAGWGLRLHSGPISIAYYRRIEIETATESGVKREGPR
jgi:hypothetical protein